MTDEYTPTTDRIWRAYLADRHSDAFRLGSETRAEFDRWMATVKAEARTEARVEDLLDRARSLREAWREYGDVNDLTAAEWAEERAQQLSTKCWR